jgi:hypothetical protein
MGLLVRRSASRQVLQVFGELSSLLTVKTLTGMTTDVYPRENCITPAIVLIVWTTDTKNGYGLAPD